MEYAGLAILAVVVLIVYGWVQKQRRQQEIRDKVRAGWGNFPQREYGWEEFDRVSHYFRRQQEQCGFFIDDITWDDLDMDRVFQQVNQTYSSVGEEYLYYLMRTPVSDREETARRDRMIRWFQEEAAGRESILTAFCQMGRVRRIALADYIFRFTELSGRSSLVHWLQAAALLAAVAGVLVRPSVFITVLIVVAAFNIYTYFSRKAEVERYFSCIGYLLAMTDVSVKIRPLCTGALERTGEEAAAAGAAFFKIRKYARLIKYQETFSGSLADLLMDYIRMLFHVDLIAFETVRTYVAAHEREATALYEALGMVESCAAVASYRTCLDGYAVPVFVEDGSLCYRSRALYHPLLADPVKNSIDESCSVLLTGSNASGKSTFLKAAAINALFAQTIVTCLADSYEACFFRVYSSMALRDDIESAESYYIVEIRALKRILDAAGQGVPVLCFVDEVLRGTNTVERIAASARILKSLPEKRMLCFAATHDIELTHLLEDLYHNYHFEEEVGETDIYFPYRLMPGRAMTRNAIRLLGMLGYDTTIIDEAQEMAAHFTETGEWKM